MTKPATPRTWVLLDTRPLYTGDSRATVLGVYDLMEAAEAQWKWLSRGVGSHITPDCQRYVILELPLGIRGQEPWPPRSRATTCVGGPK